MRVNKVCGLYVITHLPSGKFYIGSSHDTFGRVSYHKWALRNDKSPCTKFQLVYNTHPGDDTLHVLVHPCKDREAAYAMEQEWVDRHWGSPNCMNTCRNVRNSISEQLHSKEVIERRSATMKARGATAEYKKAMGERAKKRWDEAGARDSIKGAGNPFAKKVSVDGVVYGSVKDAVKAIGISEKTIRKRANLESFLNYSWVSP